MNLDGAQLAVLRTAIDAETDTEFVSYRNEGSTGLMAQWYNVAGTFIVWKTFLSGEEVKSETVWTELIGRSQGERDVYAILISGDQVNPSLENIRQAFQDIFSGPQGATTRAQLIAASKRLATRGETIFSVGTGTDATPGLLVVEGDVSNQNIIDALAL